MKRNETSPRGWERIRESQYNCNGIQEKETDTRMITQQEHSLPRVAKWGWGILLTVRLALNGVMLYVFIADSHLMQTTSVMETR